MIVGTQLLTNSLLTAPAGLLLGKWNETDCPFQHIWITQFLNHCINTFIFTIWRTEVFGNRFSVQFQSKFGGHFQQLRKPSNREFFKPLFLAHIKTIPSHKKLWYEVQHKILTSWETCSLECQQFQPYTYVFPLVRESTYFRKLFVKTWVIKIPSIHEKFPLLYQRKFSIISRV